LRPKWGKNSCILTVRTKKKGVRLQQIREITYAIGREGRTVKSNCGSKGNQSYKEVLTNPNTLKLRQVNKTASGDQRYAKKAQCYHKRMMEKAAGCPGSCVPAQRETGSTSG